MATKKKVEEIVKETESKKEVEVKKETVAQKRSEKIKNSSRRLKRVDKDIEVIVMKNVYGGWSYEDVATKALYRIDSQSSTDVIPMGDLLKMNSRNSSILGKFQIVPIDVYSDEFTIEDVIDNLSLTKKYKEAVNPLEIEDFILSNDNVSTFSETMDKLTNAMKMRVIERSIVLFQDGEFTDATKKGILMKIAKNDMIFEEK